MYDMQVVSDYPGLSGAKVKYQVGSFVDTDGEPAKCMLDDGDLQATVTSSDSGLYYSHGTAMLMCWWAMAKAGMEARGCLVWCRRPMSCL